MDCKKKCILLERRFLSSDCKKLVNQKLKNTEYEQIDFKIVPLEDKCGYFGDHYRILIRVIHKDTITKIYCFLKCIPKPESGIDLELATGAFKKEIFVFECLFKKIIKSGIHLLKSTVPECFYTKSNGLLVFEDLAKSGFEPITRYDFLNFEHTVQIIKSLAKIHASSIIYEEKQGHHLEKLFSNLDETFYSEKEDHKGTKSLFAGLKGLFTEIEIFNFDCSPMSKEEFKKKLEKACYKMLNFVKPSQKYKNVICHGDLWQTNFLMRYERNKPVQCMIIDFQTARYAPVAHDVTAFLYLTTSRIFRKRHYQELLDLYYSELYKNVLIYGINLTNIITYKEFINSCEEQKLFGAMQAATYFQLTHARSDYIAELSKNQKQWEDALYEDHSLLINENYHVDKDYKYRLNESLKDLHSIIQTYKDL